MTDQTIIETLRSIQFLNSVSDELVEKLATISALVDFPENAVIFRQGDTARSLYLIAEGRVSLEICSSGAGCKRILTLSPGELLGWSPVLERERMTATARTLEQTRAVEINGTELVKMGEENPKLGYEFMKRAALALAKRLSATRLQFVDVYGSQLPQTQDERPAKQREGA
jgi:CRP-like cAMP-binding protein